MSSPSTTTARAIEVRDLLPLDWEEVVRIYEEGIATGVATFETQVPDWNQWTDGHPDIRVVAEVDGRVAGWCALSPVSDRGCYRGVAEESVYVGSWAQGLGVGRALL